MSFVLSNFIRTTVAAPFGSGSTTLQVSSSTGLPTLAAGEMLPITLTDAATGNISEIVYCTAIAGANLTVTRAQEGTAALDWDIGDKVNCTPTAGTVETAGTDKVINVWQDADNTVSGTTTVIAPGSAPASGTGTLLMTLPVTPASASSKLRIRVYIPWLTYSGSDPGDGSAVIAIYNTTDSTFLGAAESGIIGNQGSQEFVSGPFPYETIIDSFSGTKNIAAYIGTTSSNTDVDLPSIFGSRQNSIFTIEELITN